MPINKQACAEQFVSDLSAMSSMSLAQAFTNNLSEKTARDLYHGHLVKLNAARLLYLTGNLTDEVYTAQYDSLLQKLDVLKPIIWPGK